jgi:hypothetical protein
MQTATVREKSKFAFVNHLSKYELVLVDGRGLDRH